jgi:hypothetical protein
MIFKICPFYGNDESMCIFVSPDKPYPIGWRTAYTGCPDAVTVRPGAAAAADRAESLRVTCRLYIQVWARCAA